MSDEMQCEFETMGYRCILIEGHYPDTAHNTTEPEEPDILARIEALEARVRELQEHGHRAHSGLTTGPTQATNPFVTAPADNDGNAPRQRNTTTGSHAEPQ